MPSFISCPPEIIYHVLQSCDNFTDAIALASTCKSIHSVWLAHAPTICWHVGISTEIHAFDDAIRAVRATNVAEEAIRAGRSPPHPFPMHLISGEVKVPSLAELKQVFTLQHLVKCLEAMFEMQENLFSIDYACERHEPPTEPGALYLWRQEFFRSMYRVFLAGAVLAGAYQEPFTSEAVRKRPLDFLQNHVPRDDSGDEEYEITTRDVRTLKQFPVYSFHTPQNYEDVFGPFVEWLVEESKARALRKIRDSQSSREDTESKSADSDSELIHQALVDDVFQLLYGYTQLCGPRNFQKVKNVDYKPGYGRAAYNEKDQSGYRGEVTLEGETRKISAILFGVFQLEEISMPAKVKDAPDMCLIASSFRGHQPEDVGLDSQRCAGSQPESLLPKPVDIPRVLDMMFKHSDQHSFGELESIAPPLQLFTFIFDKYFNCKLENKHIATAVWTCNDIPGDMSKWFPWFADL